MQDLFGNNIKMFSKENKYKKMMYFNMFLCVRIVVRYQRGNQKP